MNSMPRIFVPLALHAGELLSLPAAAARHVQVLRFQPGQALTLFNGEGGEFGATVQRMGKSDVTVNVGAHAAVEREAARPLHLAVALMANERMDWLVEKATELGAASLQPLITSRCVLRLQGERADKRIARWELAVIAACEQCGRNRLMKIHPIQSLGDWLKSNAATTGARAVLSLSANATGAAALGSQLAPAEPLTLLSGPEGGLSDAEELHAITAGFAPVSLGPRVLRAETAALAAAAVFGVV
jgi:16S rRNA (uracil1498-N3)-methyltransferase